MAVVAVLTVGGVAQTAVAAPETGTQVRGMVAARVTTTLSSRSAVEAYVGAVYADLFNRDADGAGLVTWSAALQSGTPRVAVANAITYSAEYRSRLIAASYDNYLGRAPDTGGLRNWLAMMSRGGTIQQMEAGFLASPEYYRRAGSTDAGWVRKLYAHVLGRSAGASEVEHWAGALHRGTSRFQVSMGFLLSAEHLTTVVDGYYQELLGRSIDAAGRAGWVRAIQGGMRLEAVIGGIVASDEYVNRVTGAAVAVPAASGGTSSSSDGASSGAGGGSSAAGGGSSGAGDVSATGRVAWLQPFASSTPWNTSLGSGAQFESVGATKTASLLTGSAAVNSANWSIAVFHASSSDPMATVTNLADGAVYSLRIPRETRSSGGTDKHVGIVEPDGVSAWEFYKMTNVGTDQWTTTRVVRTDLRVDGMADGSRASGISFFIGLVRQQELASLSINHVLAVGIPNSMLESGPVWPARTEDRDGATAYGGSIPMGSMVAIPPDVNVDALPLTAEGRALAHALQDYGAYVLIRSSSVALYCELSCDSAQVTNLHNDWRNTIFPLMRVVTNSTADNVAGGGTRRQPALPEVG